MKNKRTTPLRKTAKTKTLELPGYEGLLSEVVSLIEEARHASARTVNVIMTATYWRIGRRIVEVEQGGKERADYGQLLLERLAVDLTARFGRGFSARNVWQMRAFYAAWPILQTLSAESTQSLSNTTAAIPQTLSAESNIRLVTARFPLAWSAYVRLLSVRNEHARCFYEAEALRGGWSVRQLNRQIESQFYERTALSKNKIAMLAKGAKARQKDRITPEEELRDPYVLEFLDLKDEYSENDLEESLILHLEHFLMELGGDFTFVGRQKRLRIDDEWYRVDLLFFHRRLRCLVVIDLKRGKLTHADAGQMHMYLNYAREHWTLPDENPPVGLILCSQKGEAMARYALEGLGNKILASEYRTALPSESIIEQEIDRARKHIEKAKS
jgi:predicted nuclease of restriction endonuclease-like (RecB) superfamily